MTSIILYFKLGFRHIWDIHHVDYALFIMALFAVFLMRDWRKAMVLYLFYAFGHSLSMYLSTFGVLNIKMELITYFIPLSMFIAAASNIFKKPTSLTTTTITKLIIATTFGVVHGFGLADYLKSIMNLDKIKIVPVLSYNLGVEAGFLLITFLFLFLSWIFVNNLGMSRRDWYLIISSGIAGVALTLMFESRYWLS